MADLLKLSSDFIDNGVAPEHPLTVNRINGELSEIAPNVAMIEAFSHVVVLDSGDGLVLFDTSLEQFGPQIVKAIRGWRDAPVRMIAYTHGHIDHVGGCAAVMHDARARGDGRPQVIGHANVAPRFHRYARTNGYNAAINARQFGGGRQRPGMLMGANADRFGPAEWVAPDTEFNDRMTCRCGGLHFEMRHDKGETDDHLWAWIPEIKAVAVGDFLTWVFPNAGNPQKVQRYPAEWAQALRDMAALEPELLLPAHGLPIAGKARIARVLDDIAGALEFLVENTLKMMNDGQRLDAILHEVKLPQATLEKPYMRPVYDEPEFVVRNIWRLYGGWHDGNPARLKPPKDEAVARETAALAGGADKLAARARALSEAGDHRLACHFAELAALADPDSHVAHAARADVYEARMKTEMSLMARGVYGDASKVSRDRSGKNET
jgi:alkyl sulfatase BDS1-like metallo-beta-lactamase superfamily hydrolase